MFVAVGYKVKHRVSELLLWVVREQGPSEFLVILWAAHPGPCKYQAPTFPVRYSSSTPGSSFVVKMLFVLSEFLCQHASKTN